MKLEFKGDSGISCTFSDQGILICYTGEAAKYYGEVEQQYPYSFVSNIRRVLGSIEIEWKDGSCFNIVPVGVMGKIRVEMNVAIEYTKKRIEEQS